ncbi:6-phosphofructokinase II, partial [Escherichia coli]
MMVRIYTLTLAPSLDSATITLQIYTAEKLRSTPPVLAPHAVRIHFASAMPLLGVSATALFTAAASTQLHLIVLLRTENSAFHPLPAPTPPRQNFPSHCALPHMQS